MFTYEYIVKKIITKYLARLKKDEDSRDKGTSIYEKEYLGVNEPFKDCYENFSIDVMLEIVNDEIEVLLEDDIHDYRLTQLLVYIGRLISVSVNKEITNLLLKVITAIQALKIKKANAKQYEGDTPLDIYHELVVTLDVHLASTKNWLTNFPKMDEPR